MPPGHRPTEARDGCRVSSPGFIVAPATENWTDRIKGVAERKGSGLAAHHVLSSVDEDVRSCYNALKKGQSFTMTLQIALMLFIIAGALALFSVERLPPDVVALGVLSTLLLTGLLSPAQALDGFSSDTVILIFGLLLFTAALVRTGVVDMVGRFVLRLAGDRPGRLSAVIAIVAAALSAFISNTATTALFVPITLSLARRAKMSASKLLMPLAFASILASSVTLVGSSTNIVVSGLMSGYDLPPLGMFELTLVGLPIMVAGLIYLLLIGQKLIPNRGERDTVAAAFGIRPYLVEAIVLPDSPLVGKTLLESGLGRDMDLTVLRVLRDVNHHLAPRAGLSLAQGDELLLKGDRDDILQIRDSAGLGIKAEVRLSDPRLQAEDMQMVEAILLPWSPLIGQTLKQVSFRERYGLQVLGISRQGRDIYRKLSQVPLRTGDQLLLQGSPQNIALADRQNVVRVLGTIEHRRPNLRRAPIAIAIFGGVLAAIALNLLPLPVAILLGILLVFGTRCIAPDRAYREMEWKALIVIGSMLALGAAMEQSGAAAYLAAQIAALAEYVHPVGLLSAFFVLALLLTQPMSNQAAAVVVVPVAMQTATQLGLNPRTFAVMIAVGASCSFITPLEPACLIVYGPGRYRFTDFVKVGAGLTLLVYGIAIALVPAIWPL
jgi:di/tricarboxylate transporter